MTSDIQTANPLLGADYLTEAQTADFLGVHKRTLYRRYLERTGPPCIAVGRKIFYKRASVLAWLDSRERQQVAGIVHNPQQNANLIVDGLWRSVFAQALVLVISDRLLAHFDHHPVP